MCVGYVLVSWYVLVFCCLGLDLGKGERGLMGLMDCRGGLEYDLEYDLEYGLDSLEPARC